MAEAVVSVVLQQLAMIIDREVELEVGLVVGVKKDVKKLKSSLQTIQAVLIDAERRQVKEGAVRGWLDKLRNISYDMDDILDEWSTSILKSQIEGVTNISIPRKKVCFFFPTSCFCFKQVILRRDIALKIRGINEELDVVVREKDIYNFNTSRHREEPQRLKYTSFVDVSEICGRDEDKNTLVSKLCESSEEQKGPHIISIVGMGGIGKTTMAQLVYNDSEVIHNFEKRIWVSVSDPFDAVRIAKAIIEALKGVASNLVELESLLHCIRESVAGKKFLLVLDDVWTEDYNKWEPLHHCLKNSVEGSKVLITTRKESVARIMKSIDIIHIEELSEENCWTLFRQLAFSDRSVEECETLEEVGRKIVGKCKGLPLAAKTMGSLLRFKKTREEWQYILDSEMWKLEEVEKGIFVPLLLSYNDLPSMVKRCFSYCAIFPKDYEMNKDELIRLWMAQGYLGLAQDKEMEMIGEEYFDNLTTRSFFQEFKKGGDFCNIFCKMHDIVHDFAQFLTENECVTIEANRCAESIINSSYEKAHHLMLITNKTFSAFICNIKKLRSLLILDSSSSENDSELPKVFNQLSCLRALYIRGDRWTETSYKEIPKEVGKLIHLRYLSLYNNVMIEELPETLCELYNLQTLEISSCLNLRKLPQEMGKLINLRHLVNVKTPALHFMPKGIERLTFLQTLREFVVGGSDRASEACSLECLKNFNQLRGSLTIKMLGDVTNASEVEKAELKNKKNLISLELRFYMKKEDEMNYNNDERVLEALQPHLNLERLQIEFYRGNLLFPTWMMLLTKLKKLTLRLCINCEHLLPLGKLSSLESLYIRRMDSVKRVGNEFLGTENDNTSTSSSVIAFPKLKSLSFSSMEEWEEWDNGNTIMPRLRFLSIGFCQKLKALPDIVFSQERWRN